MISLGEAIFLAILETLGWLGIDWANKSQTRKRIVGFVIAIPFGLLFVYGGAEMALQAGGERNVLLALLSLASLIVGLFLVLLPFVQQNQPKQPSP